MSKSWHQRIRVYSAAFVVACAWAIFFVVLPAVLALVASAGVTAAAVIWLRSPSALRSADVAVRPELEQPSAPAQSETVAGAFQEAAPGDIVAAEPSAATHQPEAVELLDRAALFAQLEPALAAGQRIAVLALDLGGVTYESENPGSVTSEARPAILLRRFQGCLREHDRVALLDGEFTVLLFEAADPFWITETAQRLIAALAPSVEADAALVNPAPSIGIVVSDGRVIAPDELLRRARFALNQASGLGGGRIVWFEARMMPVATSEQDSASAAPRLAG